MHDASGRTSATSARGLSETHTRVTVRGTGLLSAATVTCGVLSLYFLVEAFEPFSVFRLILGIATATLTLRLAIRGNACRNWRWNRVAHADPDAALAVRRSELFRPWRRAW